MFHSAREEINLLFNPLCRRRKSQTWILPIFRHLSREVSKLSAPPKAIIKKGPLFSISCGGWHAMRLWHAHCTNDWVTHTLVWGISKQLSMQVGRGAEHLGVAYVRNT